MNLVLNLTHVLCDFYATLSHAFKNISLYLHSFFYIFAAIVQKFNCFVI